MSVPNAGIAVAANPPEAEDPTKDAELNSSDFLGEDRPVAPDQFDPKYETSRWERWAYYCYYIGNNGLTLFNFAPTSFQDLLYEAAGDSERLQFLGAYRTVNSIVLLANGISFAIQVVLFLLLGSMADYGKWRPWILIFWSVVAFALGFGWLGVHTEDKWKVATGLYMVGLIAYQMCITFWTAAFPGLARNMPEMRQKAEDYENREITREEYDFADMMQRNRIYNLAFVMQSGGEIIILAVLVGILFALDVNASDANNLWGLSVLIAYCTGVWVVLAIPWFILEKRRPGQRLPPGMNFISVGFWNIYRALLQIWELKQSLLYLVGKTNHDVFWVSRAISSNAVSRVFSSRRFTEYDRHTDLDPSKLRGFLQHFEIDIPAHSGYCGARRRHSCVLAHSKTIWSEHQNDV